MLRGEAANTNFIILSLTHPAIEPTIYCTQSEHPDHHIAEVVKKVMIRYIIYIVSDCCLMPIQQFFSYMISWREQINFQWNDDEVRFVLDQHADLDFYSASSLKQPSAGW